VKACAERVRIFNLVNDAETKSGERSNMSKVSLSELPRAALAAREGYWWINGIAIALSLVIARMSWVAYAALGQQDRALVCIVSQALAIALAILARRALTGEMPLAAVGAGGLAIGCAWWASHGLALAWYGDQNANSQPMVVFMAALEPALFLLAEHVREGRDPLRVAHAKAEADEAAELEAIRARQARRDAEEAARRGATEAPAAPAVAPDTSLPARRAAKAAGATVVAGAVAVTGQTAAADAPRTVTPPAKAKAEIVAPAHAGADGKVAQAMALKGQVTRAEAASRLNCSERTVTRLWRRGEAENAHALAGAA